MCQRLVTARALERISVGNAAGLVSTPEEIEYACGNNGLTEVTIGPITLRMRPGNSGSTYTYDPETHNSVNSRGLPNKGLPWYLENIRQIYRRAHTNGKRVRASIVGLEPGEFGKLAQSLRYAGVDEIELNFGCPNVWSLDGTQKPILSYDPAAVKEVLAEVRAAVGTGIPIAVKISPVPDDILEPLVTVIIESEIVTKVVGVNTWPNTRLKISGRPALRFKPHGATEESPWLDAGGGGGTILREHRRRVVRYLANHLPVGMKVIAVGCIFDGTDALEALQDGAHGFQIGTAYAEFGGPHAIDTILSGLSQLVPGD